jgi:glycosyltransferase involved in cell wall biosynthesis
VVNGEPVGNGESLASRQPGSAGSAALRPRAVILVANSANPYSRALRTARSLAGAGYDVEIAAVDEPGVPREERDGEIVIRRYVPEHEARLTRLVGIHQARQLVLWPEADRGWYRTLRRQVRPADLYHACGYRAVGVALDLAAAARRGGRAGRVIYDVIDVQLETERYAELPGLVRTIHAIRERRWIQAVDAVVTVNQPIADHLVRSWSLSGLPTVLLNCPPRWTPPAGRPTHLRDVTGIPPERAVVLFIGKLAGQRGLDEAAEAVLRLPDAAFVLMGFGAGAAPFQELDHDVRFAGRHFTIPPVHPDAVPEWTASADVSIVAVPPNSLNQRLVTPNKFWESLTAGTPVVVGRDLEVMREIVAADDLGANAESDDPAALARALAAVLDRPPAERLAMRERCLRVAWEGYNWEMAVEPYLALVRRLAAPAA